MFLVVQIFAHPAGRPRPKSDTSSTQEIRYSLWSCFAYRICMNQWNNIVEIKWNKIDIDFTILFRFSCKIFFHDFSVVIRFVSSTVTIIDRVVHSFYFASENSTLLYVENLIWAFDKNTKRFIFPIKNVSLDFPPGI